MSRDTFYSLLKKYQEGNCSEEEKQVVEEWYTLLEDENELKQIDELELTEIDERLWGFLNSKINIEQNTVKPIKKGRSIWPKLSIAASVTILLVGALFFFLKVPADEPKFLTEEKTEIQETVLVKVNNTENPVLVSLSDKSTVTLQPGAKLTYPNEFATNKREVQLEGVALFDIQKNPEKPFLVYSNHLITKVLGTSFIVRTNGENQKSEVEVLTGKVLVTKNVKKSIIQNIIKEKQEVFLTPNQRAIYNFNTNKLESSIVVNPLPLTSNTKKQDQQLSFIYEEAKLQKIFNEIESTYGIKIEPSDKGILNCTFTGDLSDQDMYTMLAFVCESIGVSYQVIDTTILIKGAACSPENQ
ncbi:FecR family protein [Chondrinema litorale]|uniref:FecR family protein n=1 Tax=Chondrinema litorale TaxID=2994555 RepID=UPI0025432783|nr:FecR family protein [Chondrinema litorale]UZR96711.1 FecR family protein [Chondrinema litorale]